MPAKMSAPNIRFSFFLSLPIILSIEISSTIQLDKSSFYYGMKVLFKLSVVGLQKDVSTIL